MRPEKPDFHNRGSSTSRVRKKSSPIQFRKKAQKGVSESLFSVHLSLPKNMAVFEEHKTQLVELLKLIPEELFSKIAIETGVDYYAKVLQRNNVVFDFFTFSYKTLAN
jgi:hypothetical protein